MGQLKLVTITGADDNTNPEELVRLSEKFPFVEWGILVSKNSVGNPRFPSYFWMDHFCDVAIKNNLKVSMHLCGTWVRQLLMNALDFNEIPSIINCSNRVQINTHAECHPAVAEMYGDLANFQGKQIILQIDGVNTHLYWAAMHLRNTFSHVYDFAGLFDLSHGTGVVPERWEAIFNEWGGYAGGLGPHNVESELSKITAMAVGDFWIDMETHVRTSEVLDLQKVERVLEICAPHVVS